MSRVRPCKARNGTENSSSVAKFMGAWGILDVRNEEGESEAE